MPTSNEIGFFLQNFKTLEPLKIGKWLIHPMEALVKEFFLKKEKR